MACTSDAAGAGNSRGTGCARSPAGKVETDAFRCSYVTKIDGIRGNGKSTGAQKAVFAPGRARNRGTWCTKGHIRPRWGSKQGYLVHQRPYSPQVKAREGVPGAPEAESAPGPERKAMAQKH